MKYLDVKRRRDIRRQRWQFLAVLVTIALGVMLFATSYDAYLNLEASYNGTYDRLRFADMTVTGAREGFVDEASAIAGVAVVEARRQADVPFRVGDDLTFLGRVVGMPVDGQPEINQIDVTAGRYLTADDPTGVVIETHMADSFGLQVGDSFTVVAGVPVDLEVVGIAVSAEYLWPARNRQDIFPPPQTFGVAFIDESLLADVTSAAVADQTLFVYSDDADVTATDAAITAAAEAADAADVQTQADHPSNSTLQLDVQGFQQLAIAFPALFLLAAGMAAYIVLTRIVFSQRGQIGTLRASGVSRKALRRHYLSYGVILGLAGAVIGLVLGMAMAWGLTGLYTDALGIPDSVRELHPITPIVGMLFGLAAGTLAALAPARTVFKMSPAEAMRGDPPVSGGTPSLFERIMPPLRRLPVRWRMTLRGIGRNKRRSTSTVLGVVLALTLILASWGMIDTMVNLLDRQFNEIAIEDAVVVYSVPVEDDHVEAALSDPQVTVAERVAGLAVTLKANGSSYATALEGYQRGTEVHGFAEPLPASGALVGQALRDVLGVDVGDQVTVELTTLDSTFVTTVAGFVDEPLGTFAYMELAALEDALAGADPAVAADVITNPAVASVKALFDDGAEPAAVIDRLHDLPDVATVVDAQALANLVADFVVFFYAFIGVMLVFGGAMAFALIFNTISVNVAERSGEFATMRANGLSHRRVAALIAGENLLLTVLGIIPGLVVGYLVAGAFMASYSNDQFNLALQMRPLSLVLSALAMLAVAALSLIPAIRAVRRIDIGAVVRERAV